MILKNKKISIEIFQGQIINLKKESFEYFHGGGKSEESKNNLDKKGWSNSEIIMFPIVGPAKEFCVNVDESSFSQDQHGVARILTFDEKKTSDKSICLTQTHDGKTLINNPKYLPSNKRPKNLEWPFAYTLEKQINLSDDKVIVTLTLINQSNEDMPYMLGWHPAFRVLGDDDNLFETDNGKQFNLNDILTASIDGAYILEGINSIKYTNRKTGRGVELLAKDFGNMMLWSPGKDAGMFCTEPVTHLPDFAERNFLFHNNHFNLLKPSDKKTYSVTIHPF